MDSRIKTGENLKCEYTGVSAEALIKIYGEGDAESAWMGSDVLSQALKLLASVQPSRDQTGYQSVDKMPNWIDEPVPMGNPVPRDLKPVGVFSNQEAGKPTPRTPGRNVKVPAEVVQNFTEVCNELKKNPPANKEGKVDGVPETSIRDIIKNFLPYFKNNPNQMFTPLRVAFGFDPARFQTIIEGLERKRG